MSSILGCSGHCREGGQFQITIDINLGLKDVWSFSLFCAQWGILGFRLPGSWESWIGCWVERASTYIFSSSCLMEYQEDHWQIVGKTLLDNKWKWNMSKILQSSYAQHTILFIFPYLVLILLFLKSMTESNLMREVLIWLMLPYQLHYWLNSGTQTRQKPGGRC